MNAALHYIYDPLCGWCYGAEPLVKAAARIDGLALVMHAGGLWPEPTRLPAAMREYIKKADARVGDMSGQPYGEAYLNGLLFDPDLVLDSGPTTAAILAAESLRPGSGLAMLEAIQHAHYERGLHVVRREVLAQLAGELGFATPEFEAAASRSPVEMHISDSRRLMGRIGAGGFPAFVLELDGQWLPVAHHEYSGSPERFRDRLVEQRDGHRPETLRGVN